MARPEARTVVVAVSVGLVLGGIAALAVLVSGRPPEGPVAVDWDGTRCFRCGMLVSDPAFAAQLHLDDGRVRHYDDPGCLLAELAEPDAPQAHAAWVHDHLREDWIPLEQAAFVRVPHSPMGYGLGAVAKGDADGAIDLETARAAIAAKARAQRAPSSGTLAGGEQSAEAMAGQEAGGHGGMH